MAAPLLAILLLDVARAAPTTSTDPSSSSSSSSTASTPAPPPPLCRGLADAAATSRCRVALVKGAIRHAWTGYVEHGWGSDDFSPSLGKGVENWHARSTIYDSLDTLYLAGMTDEFDSVRFHGSSPASAPIVPAVSVVFL